MLDKPVFKEIYQVALVVRDCHAWAKKYADEYGIGPWTFNVLDPKAMKDMVMHDKEGSYAMRAAITKIGNVQFELVEPLDDKSPYAEFLKKHGEGLHHVDFLVDDYGETLRFFRGKGVGVLMGGNWHGIKFTYFDSQKELGLIAEIVEYPRGLEAPKADDVYPRAK